MMLLLGLQTVQYLQTTKDKIKQQAVAHPKYKQNCQQIWENTVAMECGTC